MLFTSLVFIIFFAVVYASYLLTSKNFRVQNYLLLAASYVFYGFWDYRFCFLLLGTTLINYLIGRKLAALTDEKVRKQLCTLGVTCSLTMLGFFKYFNFFEESLFRLFGVFGLHLHAWRLELVLPVGMSFYTFKEISYVVDIYRRKLEPEPFFPNFALYVSFFPQLVAGPIERAGEMLPAIRKPRSITLQDVDEGIYLIVWGFFKKVFIADNLGGIVNPIFDHYTKYHGLDLALAVFGYTFQIYCDFSGYTDVARGLARLLGFHLPLNFRLPYFATDPSDFWQRWHISLSSWLRDYLYIPLGGNRKGETRTQINLMITMLLGGLWHGANWNFILWGGYHGAILVLYRKFGGRRKPDDPIPGWQMVGSILLMFCLTLVGWLFFRAHSLNQIVYFLTHTSPSMSADTKGLAVQLVEFILPLVLVQLIQQKTKNLLVLMRLQGFWRLALYVLLFGAIALFGKRAGGEFIYFQF